MKMNKAAEAESLFRQGFNCSQAVLGVFAQDLGLSIDAANKIACAFGGGMRIGGTCGAVTGALMAIGLEYGKTKADDNEARNKTYMLAKEFQMRFSALKGSVYCRDLLGYDLGAPEGYQKAKECRAFEKICPFLVRDAVVLLLELIDTIEP